MDAMLPILFMNANDTVRFAGGRGIALEIQA